MPTVAMQRLLQRQPARFFWPANWPPNRTEAIIESKRTLIIGCGALARELRAVVEDSSSESTDLVLLPAALHNSPTQIPDRVTEIIDKRGSSYRRVLVAYGDCGTGGLLDTALRELGVDRLDGAHCYEFLAGKERFDELMADQPGTFFLTDSLARNFKPWIWEGLGLDRNPELRKTYFANYHRLVYLSQSATERLVAKAKDAATLLGLKFEQVSTGLEPFSRQIRLKLRTER